jgi:hypothetical protein
MRVLLWLELCLLNPFHPTLKLSANGQKSRFIRVGKLCHIGMVLMYADRNVARQDSRMLGDDHPESFCWKLFIETCDVYHAGLIFAARHEKSLKAILDSG